MPKRTNNALEVLHKRYIEGDSKRKPEILVERFRAGIVRLVLFFLRANAIAFRWIRKVRGDQL